MSAVWREFYSQVSPLFQGFRMQGHVLLLLIVHPKAACAKAIVNTPTFVCLPGPNS